MLSEEEMQGAERFRFQQHRRSFTVSRGILRTLLSRYTGLPAESIESCTAWRENLSWPAGREASELTFNLSQAGLLGLYAFSWGRRLGIDVECIRPMEDMDQVALRNFSPKEYRKFQSIPSEVFCLLQPFEEGGPVVHSIYAGEKHIRSHRGKAPYDLLYR